MTNKLKGFIFFSKKIKDNDLYIKILSSNNEINAGIVYGGNSSKKKLVYQNGYFIEFNITKKNEHAPPIIIGEITKPFLGNIFTDKYKLNALLSILSLINVSIVEGQYIKGLYDNVESLVIKIIAQNHWINFYCEWLFDLLRSIGYQIDYSKNSDKKYFDIVSQEFTNEYNRNNIEFPHNFFSDKNYVNFKNLDAIFLIFESIFLKNHLDDINYKMPRNFINFRNIIIKYLKCHN